LARQKISAAALFRKAVDPASGITNWEQGMDYQVFEGHWSSLPDFQQLTPIKTGVSSDLGLRSGTRDKNVALRFHGYFQAPRDGAYTFSVVSAGSHQLSLGLPSVKAVGTATLEAPKRFRLGQVLAPGIKSSWTEMEGTVSFVSRKGLGGFQFELSSETGRLGVDIGDGSSVSPESLLGSRVRVVGICRTTYTLDGQLTAGVMWVPNLTQVTVLESAAKHWPLANTNSESGQLPLLTALGQIIQMKREEAARGYPVKVRGVVVWSGGSTCQICDPTGGIYVDAHELVDKSPLPLRAREYWEIEGVTEGRFSPIIMARRAVRLGLGTPPEPTQPTIDQLLNGTLDAQYVEIQGIATEVHTNRLTMLTRGGKIQVYLVPPMWDGEPSVLTEDGSIQQDWSSAHVAALKSYEGALLRVRGSLSPVKNRVTLQFTAGEVQMRAAVISVDRPAPLDPFDAPAKRAAELLMFDAQATAFQPVKVTGQVLHQRNGEICLMDGNQGLRFIPRQPVKFTAGDVVEVAGFPELGGPSPVLREADARKIGQSALPRPQRLLASAPLLFNGSYDSTLVQLQARLINLSAEHDDLVLGLQMGPHFFVARLEKPQGTVHSIPVGSLLDVTGVYVGRGTTPGQGIDAFELLLNSPSDIRVLAQPSWWTLKRLAGIVGLLVGVIAGSSVWIGLLRRQVEQRTQQLRREISEREQAEQQRAVEAERSRIARDLHDDLGSSLTEISLLADAGPGSPPSFKKAGNRFHLISEKARTLINALDVIVWLVNPRKDSLPFLASYLSSYAEEYLSASGIACRLKIPLNLPPLPLSAETRHGLFLAVKETLNNAVRHAGAREVLLELSTAGSELSISIADNGRGFEPAVVSRGNGLNNLHERLTRLGGRCVLQSTPGKGTTVVLTFPLPAAPAVPIQSHSEPLENP
jgi:signal transduction histidine kinase